MSVYQKPLFASLLGFGLACGQIRYEPILEGTVLAADAGAEGSGDSGDSDAGPADSGHARDASTSDGARDGCTPQCSGRECGPDGCGKSCGICAGSGSVCTVGGQCQCTPFCGTRTCGDDGCGGSCGTCPADYTCVINGSCQKDPGSQCGVAVCGSAASCCHCNGQPLCYALSSGMTCEGLGAGCH